MQQMSEYRTLNDAIKPDLRKDLHVVAIDDPESATLDPMYSYMVDEIYPHIEPDLEVDAVVRNCVLISEFWDGENMSEPELETEYEHEEDCQEDE